MELKIEKFDEFKWETIEGLKKFSIFSSYNLIRLYKDCFKSDVVIASIFDDESIRATLPLVRTSDRLISVGHLEDKNVFDHLPISFREVNDAVSLITKIVAYANENKFSLKISEIPIEIIRKHNFTDCRLSTSSIQPICNIRRNIDVKSGQIIFKKKYRKELKRKTNRILGEYEIRFEEKIDKTFYSEILIDFFKKSDNQEKRQFLTEENENYFRRLIENEDISLTGMFLNNNIVSIAIYFDLNNIRYLYNMASDTDFYHYAPGLIHVSKLVEKTVEQNFDEFNFLRGEERYKFEIGANSCSANYEITNQN